MLQQFPTCKAYTTNSNVTAESINGICRGFSVYLTLFTLHLECNTYSAFVMSISIVTLSAEISFQQVEQILTEKFAFSKSKIVNVTKLVGYDNVNFQISTSDSKKYVLKVFAHHLEKEVLEAQFVVVKNLILNLAPGIIADVYKNTSGSILTPIILPNAGYPNGATHFCVLSSWVPGVPLQNMKSTSADKLFKIGAFVGVVSAALFSIPDDEHKSILMARDNKWNTLNLAACKPLIDFIEDDSRRELVKKFFDKWENEIIPASKNIEQCVIYGDYNACNMLVSDEIDWEICGLIDFEDIGVGTLSSELGNLMAYMDIFEGFDVLSVGSHILKGFTKTFSISLQEVNLLYYMVAARCIMSNLYGLHQYSLNPENEYLLLLQNSNWRTYLTLERIGYSTITKHWRTAAGY